MVETTQHDEGLTPVKAWEIARAKITHEDSWIQQRVSWNLASSSFLIASFVALVLSPPQNPSTALFMRRLLIVLIPLAGLFFSIAVLVGLIAAAIAINVARKEWNPNGTTPPDRQAFPALHSTSWALWLGRFASWGTTMALILFWLLVLTYSSLFPITPYHPWR